MQAENIDIFGLETMVYIVCFAKFFFFSWFYGWEMQYQKKLKQWLSRIIFYNKTWFKA